MQVAYTSSIPLWSQVLPGVAPECRDSNKPWASSGCTPPKNQKQKKKYLSLMWQHNTGLRRFTFNSQIKSDDNARKRHDVGCINLKGEC